MSDPQPAFGRFTSPVCEPPPRDDYEWLCEAEEVLCKARRGPLARREKLALLERAIECIEQAKGWL
jgi:hypothetical protein